MVSSSNAFVITQFGLSCFRPSNSSDGPKYVAKTFNFYCFPRPFEDWDPRFLCASGSLDFLGGCNFDFNKWIKDGISCMPASLRDAKLAAVDKERERSEIRISKSQDVAFKAEMVGTVKAWLAGSAREVVLTSANSYQRAIQYQELKKDQFGAAHHPGFYIEVSLGDAINSDKLYTTLEDLHGLDGFQ